MGLGVTTKGLWMAACMAGLASAAHAQPRPDAGTLQEPQRLLPTLPAPGGPRPTLPQPPAQPAPTAQARIVPTEFRFEGNQLFSSAALAAVLAPRLNQPTTLAGLQEAAREVKAFYQRGGYLLTDVYLPQQSLRAEGGPVLLSVVEARVGDVTVRAQGAGADTRAPAAAAYDLARRYLRRGDPVTEYGLDQPVLLLRDLSGHEAVATVEPGTRPGEVNVLIDVRAAAPRLEASVGLDNHGTRAAGELRAFATLDLANVTGRGDALSARVQAADMSGTHLFRLSYALQAPGATRVTAAAARTEYTLGKQFAALGATGRADVFGLSALHPLLRSRNRNLYLSAGLDHKQMDDQTLVSPATQRRIASAFAGVLGNVADDAGDLAQGSFTSYAARLTAGHVSLDAGSQAVDQGPGGLRTAGQFGKLNLEAQHMRFWRNGLSLLASFQGQLASKNLVSAEKMSLGGPAGVRGYPVGEAVGDSGALLGLELRYPLQAAARVAGAPVNVTAFYDVGTVRFNQDGAAAGSNDATLDSAGLGLMAGRAGQFTLTASLAWRLGSPLPAGGEPDRSPRVWLNAQKWF